MTTLLIATVVYFFYCAFVYQPQAEVAPVTVEVAQADEPINYPSDWTQLDNTITKPMIGWDCVYNTLTTVQLPAIGELPTVEEAVKGLMTYTIRELKKIASTYKVKGYGKMTKAQLCEALEAIGCA